MAKRPRCGDHRCGSRVIRHQAEHWQLGHLYRHPRQGGGSLRRIWFNSLGRTCAHNISHPREVVCHADVNLSSSAGEHMLDVRGFITPCFKVYQDQYAYKQTKDQ